MARFTFIMEQTLGHVVHSRSMQMAAASQHYSQDTFSWILVPFVAEDKYQYMPGARSNWTLRGSLRARAALTQQLRQQQAPNALFLHTQTISQLCTPYLRKIPSIISLDATPENIQEMASEYGQPASSAPADALKKHILLEALHTARLLVCWNAWAAASLQTSYGIDAQKIRIIPAGVDTRAFSPTVRMGRKGPCRLLFVGGDFERKGGPELLQAFSALRASGVELELDLVCPSPPLIKEGQGINIHTNAAPGSQQMHALYAAADIFVLPSRGDCLPLAILEAMACGLPVVSADVGAIKEAAKPDVNARLCPPRNADALASSILEYANSALLRAEHGAKSREIAISSFDAMRGFQQIVDCLQEVSGETR
jgi:glycosyltransferase involved in cell wall biosynthesis